MRCAIIIGGVLRKYSSNYHYFLKAFQNISEIDIYASINKHILQSAIEFSSLYNVKKVQINHLDINLLGPEYNDIVGSKSPNILSMYYHNKMAFELVKNSGIAYDYIVKYRSDCIINDSHIPFDDFEPGHLYIPYGQDWGGVNDQIAIGDFATMSKYCSLYNHIVKYVKKNGCKFHPETLLAHHLKHEQVDIKRFDLNYSLDSYRHD